MRRHRPGLLLTVALLCVGCADHADSPTPSESLRRQAAVLRSRNEIEPAEKLLRKAVALQPAESTDQRVARTDLLAELGALQSSAGRTGAAEESYREALALAEQNRGRPEVIINLRTQLAGLCYRRRGYQEAADLYHLVLDEEESLLGPGHPDILGTLSILGGLELRLGHLDSAEKIFRRQLAGVEKTQGHEKREVATVLDNLAEVAERAGRKQEAADLRARAAQIRHKLCDEC